MLALVQLRDDLEFNDRISVDGFTWTNTKGQTFHMYHVLDWGTNFQVASIAPSRSTEDFIKAFTSMWLSWAGVPGEILVDAGSEFNSESFMEFLQGHNIKGTTIKSGSSLSKWKVRKTWSHPAKYAVKIQH